LVGVDVSVGVGVFVKGVPVTIPVMPIFLAVPAIAPVCAPTVAP
jgi:hypothetical protein